jgi:hypothetical protein
MYFESLLLAGERKRGNKSVANLFKLKKGRIYNEHPCKIIYRFE